MTTMHATDSILSVNCDYLKDNTKILKYQYIPSTACHSDEVTRIDKFTVDDDHTDATVVLIYGTPNKFIDVSVDELRKIDRITTLVLHNVSVDGFLYTVLKNVLHLELCNIVALNIGDSILSTDIQIVHINKCVIMGTLQLNDKPHLQSVIVKDCIGCDAVNIDGCPELIYVILENEQYTHKTGWTDDKVVSLDLLIDSTRDLVRLQHALAK